MNELGRIFNKDDIREKQELMGVLSIEGYRLIGDYSLRRYQDAIKEAAKHKKGSEEYKQAMIEAAVGTDANGDPIMKSLSGPIPDWSIVHSQQAVYFEGRIPE